MEQTNTSGLENILVKENFLTAEELEKVKAIIQEDNKRLEEVVIEEHFMTEQELSKAYSILYGCQYVELSASAIPQEIFDLVPEKIAKKYRCIPVAYSDKPNTLIVAFSDPMDVVAIDDVALVSNMRVEVAVAPTSEIMFNLDKHFGTSDIDNVINDYAKEREASIDYLGDDSEALSDSPIIRFVNEMISQAVRQRASDIHIEPMEDALRIRYRIDGSLYERGKYSAALTGAISARIKIMGDMDIAEKRKPQDGRITSIVDRTEYDIRVSVLPTVYGEKIVMRLTSKNALTKAKSELGLKPDELKQFDRLISRPHGILLVTGPTGSGKSTTLYTALSELNTEDVNIITVEDPVEANIDGINQIQVNEKAKLTFATALRSILRQDPDIIMIGEIRDEETAGIAVQASITGHMVVSTLHTNSASSAITRLEDMGIEAYLIADSVVGIIAQRLVKRLCPDCKVQVDATEEEKEILGVDVYDELKIYKPCGCEKCNQTGYRGRIGVYEILEMSPDIKRTIAKGGDAEDIKSKALDEGMRTLRMSATEYVLDGTTSFKEMVKVSFDT